MTAPLTTEELHRLHRDGSRWLADARARLLRRPVHQARLVPPGTGDAEERSDD